MAIHTFASWDSRSNFSLAVSLGGLAFAGSGVALGVDAIVVFLLACFWLGVALGLLFWPFPCGVGAIPWHSPGRGNRHATSTTSRILRIIILPLAARTQTENHELWQTEKSPSAPRANASLLPRLAWRRRSARWRRCWIGPTRKRPSVNQQQPRAPCAPTWSTARPLSRRRA